MKTPKIEQAVLFDIAAVPKPQRTKWEELGEMAQVGGEVGGLIAPSLAAELMGVSRARVFELTETGRLRKWHFFDKAFVAVDEVSVYLQTRKVGRPKNGVEVVRYDK